MKDVLYIKRFLSLILGIFLISGFLISSQSDLASGLKEALNVGTKKAVELISKEDGYFSNEVIKILMPENVKKIADTLSTMGMQKQVDEFILSMNRAAEKAAPAAISIFVDAIREMSFDDAKGILTGGDTAATEYFKKKTSETIYAAFKPIVSTTMEEVGVTKTFKTLTDKYSSLPFVKTETLDLDHYVTNNALNGLFYMLGEEEKKIRTNPADRVSDILKKVFKIPGL
ncbi:DUF4197 domain-containing protein [Acidobacteriota bacterium]